MDIPRTTSYPTDSSQGVSSISEEQVCFIGNSHLAGIKLALTEDAVSATLLQPTFFGASGNLMEWLKLEDACLSPMNDELAKQMRRVSGGLSTIEIQRFSAFVLVGLQFDRKPLLQLTRTHGTKTHTQWGNVRHLMSDVAFEQTLRDIFSNMTAIRLVRLIRQVSTAPIVLVPAPAPCEAILEERSWQPHKTRVGTPYFQVIDETFQRCVRAAVDGEEARLIFQDESTLAHPCFTSMAFNREAIAGLRCKQPVESGDHWHMNRRYGGVMLEAIRRSLQSLRTHAQPRRSAA